MRKRLPDIVVLVLLFLLPLVMFWQQTLGGKTLIPTENIYQYEPFATYREVVNAPAFPHNALVSDLILQNYQWKHFTRQNIAQGEVPLWNPHQFSGIPFLAAGQHSALYPFSLIYYVLPLPVAYGWFTVVQLWLAGVFMVLFLRGLTNGTINRFAALIGGITYQLSAFFVISAVFPMIIAAAAWLPLVLLMVELTIQQRRVWNKPASVPWVVIGAGALGCMVLAGHVEITYYTLLIAGYYAAFRLVWAWWRAKSNWRHLAVRAGWLLVMVALGLALGAVQFISLFEAASTNFRDGTASYDEVANWAHPVRDIVQFIMPNFYGSPAHHTYFDIFTGQTTPVTINTLGNPINHTDWGIKNYVEGALYLGILPLALAIYALLDAWKQRKQADAGSAPYRLLFACLGLLSLTFMFGLPTYAVLFYGLPGINQLHSPFRWIFALTICVAVLAAYGAQALLAGGTKTARRFGYVLTGVGLVTLAALLLSRMFYPQIEPLIDRLFNGLAKAPEAFADATMFYSYQFTNVLTFGLFTSGAGLVFILAGRESKPVPNTPLRPWHVLAVALVALDLMIASWDFNPASDPLLLDFTPPAIEWLMQQEGDWRYTTLDDPTLPPIMNANLGWRYGLDDIRGYESIIPRQYVDYMKQLAPQVQLEFNRVAPLYTDYGGQNFDYADALQSPRLHFLNVRYVITHKSTTLPDELLASTTQSHWSLVYEDEAVRIWEHGYTPRAEMYLSDTPEPPELDSFLATGLDVTIESDTGREKILTLYLHEDVYSWLVVSETWMPGWRAFVRPFGGDENSEKPLEVVRVMDNFQGVNISQDVLQPLLDEDIYTLPLTQRLVTIRIVYSPASFQVSLFGSVVSAALLVFMVGVWLWRLAFGAQDDNASTLSRIARNSVAPIILNLFNRGIDFAFAFVMLRVLGPEGAGIYYYAIIVFGWFDIFTNFGLNLFLTREASRDRAQAGRYFFNTSILRLILAGAGVPLILGFLLIRQATITPALTSEALLAIGLLYIGLLPNSLSTGMTALFYAFEKAEYPAAVATIATINKAVLGLVALLMGFGVVGLAGVSIITNILTLAVLIYGGRQLIGRIQRRPESALMRGMVRESWPLMLNHFLATIFFQIDIIIIEALHGARMVGQYSVAYKWVMALNVIPSFFTQAMLPVLSRQAHEDRAALKRGYILALKLLVSLALPIAMVFTFLAYFLTSLLGGSEYLPDGAIATQLMIWSIPIGWMNSFTQYMLIALDLQRRITRAFALAVSFNIITNLIFIPQYGYQAAALTTIASELVLFIPFAFLMHGALGRLPWLDIIWRPVVAAGAMALTMAVGWSIQPFLALILGSAVYVVLLLLLRPLNADEQARLLPLLPGRLRTRFAPVPVQNESP